ncbi:histidine phosphatase family protein [Glycomyces sp. L485]|uniref:histidine phosphatase family protein n=1 Tax=Glycomyces sp. L485 TaxID=2909235 RepID=UPI001F4B8D44|nr:histidine phosphatase family protein [Glycomyces sp. L485]MCH7232962.1 histidine phosphatase family protein [Glycomyces sp. L485]
MRRGLMLSALILLRHAATSMPPARLDAAETQRAAAIADFLQLYNPTVLVSAPERACADTLAPLASRLDLEVTASADLAAEQPKFPGDGGPAHAAAWFASRALRALPDARRTAVVCAEGVVLAAALVAIAARDDHDLSAYGFTLPLEGPQTLPPGGGWVVHRDDGRLVDVKSLAPR